MTLRARLGLLAAAAMVLTLGLWLASSPPGCTAVEEPNSKEMHFDPTCGAAITYAADTMWPSPKIHVSSVFVDSGEVASISLRQENGPDKTFCLKPSPTAGCETLGSAGTYLVKDVSGVALDYCSCTNCAVKSGKRCMATFSVYGIPRPNIEGVLALVVGMVFVALGLRKEL